MWARGLKLLNIYKKWKTKNVAPRVGAWIETQPEPVRELQCYVAPRVGAWIETVFGGFCLRLSRVAPRVGAWIETLDCVL